jgi:superfamily II DNA/RNA helicase
VHRIGRTGRAGRSGLAVTLAERRDLLMIKRIQQFTTQKIPVAQVTGLEPRQPEPQIFAGRPAHGERRAAPKFGHAPSGGGRGAPRPGSRAPRANERRR